MRTDWVSRSGNAKMACGQVLDAGREDAPMESVASQELFLHFSTQELPLSERVPYWREVFARQICHVDIEPQPDCPLEAEATMLAMPGLGAGWCHSGSPARLERTAEHVKDGSNDFAFLMPLRGAMTRAQLGRDIEVKVGEAVGILNHEPASLQFHTLEHLVVMIPGAALSSSVSNIEAASTRLVPRGSEALRLLTGYVMTLVSGPVVRDPAAGKLVATHICDLVALAIGPTRDGREIALNRGVRAARLKAIKRDLERNPALTLGAVAARQRITPRYVQILFEEEGSTFSQFALDRRLAQAHRMLTDLNYQHWTISAIAFEAGFGDLSHFNRSFRKHYGASPSEVRVEALRSQS
jgi:AraC-like DNA-binding protein